MILCAVFLLLGSCATRDMTGSPSRTSERERRAAPPGVAAATPADSSMRQTPYDLEEEMPEKTPQRTAELVEKLEPVKPDSFSVQDIETQRAATQPPQKQLYDIGYRIQVFASADKAAAEKVKQKLATQTGMPIYLDYEDGLYKVRAGDFAERKEAAEARSKLVGLYPGSWIVRTTIRASN
jgi:septal ring-binding cell division protein DamX